MNSATTVKQKGHKTKQTKAKQPPKNRTTTKIKNSQTNKM